MSKQEDYRKHAAFTLDVATRATSNTDRLRLLLMAESWLDLAERCRQWTRDHPSLEQHPLVIAKLGDDQQEAEAGST